MANFSAAQREKEREIDVYKIFCDFLQAIDLGEGYLWTTITYNII